MAKNVKIFFFVLQSFGIESALELTGNSQIGQRASPCAKHLLMLLCTSWQ